MSLSPNSPDDLQVVEINTTDEMNYHTSVHSSPSTRSNRRRQKNETRRNNRRLSTLSGLEETVKETAAAQKRKEKHSLKRQITEFANDTNNPTAWMYKSFRHPVHGQRNYRKGEKAAIKIQAVFRGRHARNQFLYMYENKDVLKYLGTYLLFYITVFAYVMFKKTGQDGFLMQSLLRDLILDEEFSDQHTHIYKNFHDVASVEEFWHFMHGPLSNGLFPDDCYEKIRVAEAEANTKNVTFKATTSEFPCMGLVYNTEFLMGGVRMYTFRAQNDDWRSDNGDTCRSPEALHERLDNIGCYPPWEDATAETDPNFLMSGDTTNRTAMQQALVQQYDGLEQCFTTELASTIEHYPFSSQKGVKFAYFGFSAETFYPSDSYICEMLYTDGHAFGEKLKVLEQAEWVDVRTRAVMIEFSLINVNVGMVTSGRLFFDFLATGGVATNYNFATAWLFSLYPLHLTVTYFVIFCTVSFLDL